MFSIEHEFDCTVITILDEGSKQLTEDISVTNFEEYTTLEQYDPVNDRINKITFSNSQLADLAAAINCPIGPLMSYKFALNSLSVFLHPSPIKGG